MPLRFDYGNRRIMAFKYFLLHIYIFFILYVFQILWFSRLIFFFVFNSDFDVAPRTIDICVHHGGRVVTTNVLYDYWGGDEIMICNIPTQHFSYTDVIQLVSDRLNQYDDVFACYLRVPTVPIEEPYSLHKIEHDFRFHMWLSNVQVGHALDIYLAHRCYPTLIDTNTSRWLRRRWEKSGFVSGHVEAKRRISKNKGSWIFFLQCFMKPYLLLLLIFISF